jgi:hypothetical protein
MKLQQFTCLFVSGLVFGSSTVAARTVKLVASCSHIRLENAELRLENNEIRAGTTGRTIFQASQAGASLGLGINEQGQLIEAGGGDNGNIDLQSSLTTQNIADLNLNNLFVAVPDDSGYKIFVSSPNSPSDAVPIKLQIVPNEDTNDNVEFQQRGRTNPLVEKSINRFVQNFLAEAALSSIPPATTTSIGASADAPSTVSNPVGTRSYYEVATTNPLPQTVGSPSNLSVSPLAPYNATLSGPPNVSVISPSPLTTGAGVASSKYSGRSGIRTVTIVEKSCHSVSSKEGPRPTGLRPGGGAGAEVSPEPVLTNAASKGQFSAWYTAGAIGFLAAFLLVI